MTDQTTVLIASRSGEAVTSLRDAIETNGRYRVSTSVIGDNNDDPLRGVAELPDILLLRVNGRAISELEALAQRDPNKRPPLVVVGSEQHPEAMRIAMKAGARDFLGDPPDAADLMNALETIQPTKASSAGQSSTITAMINAKGGAGSSFLASSIAHVFAEVSHFRTLLVDLDFQFGSLHEYLDLNPDRGILDALQAVGELDNVAIDAYSSKFSRNLRVMAATEPMESYVPQGSDFTSLMDVLSNSCDRMVLDVPRLLDEYSAAALQRADHVVVVLQQTLPSLRDATRLRKILIAELAVGEDRITYAVNRYSKHAAVQLRDIRTALSVDELTLIPNQYKLVAEAIDIGVPILTHAPNAPVCKAIMELESKLGGQSSVKGKGLFSRAFSRIRS